MVVLIIIEELMSKTKDLFLDHFARLGVFTKVQVLMGSYTDNDTDVISSKSQEEGAIGKPAKGQYLLYRGVI